MAGKKIVELPYDIAKELKEIQNTLNTELADIKKSPELRMNSEDADRDAREILAKKYDKTTGAGTVDAAISTLKDLVGANPDKIESSGFRSTNVAKFGINIILGAIGHPVQQRMGNAVIKGIAEKLNINKEHLAQSLKDAADKADIDLNIKSGYRKSVGK